ncbi:hypothetical protein ASL14_07990 [Paenibacillus sp. IHB B 3084]|uniref:Ig-like domain-containing protein n=1 Tax=Paenibacillus sp. IHB B 3084 TaxID=867076 RepID=UPI000722A746|nr:Ig-like domain-containing protein [Paenibacillus sp. IHB B 3084]ALP36117.1 hypothetical protein ASL14_07990 [Paenibacillus sp. IHB B 3084]
MLKFKKTIVALLVLMVSTAYAADMTDAAESKKVYVDVTSSDASVLPGQTVFIEVGISSIALADTKGIQAAKITLSYDENVFTTDSLLRFDDDLGKYIWRDDCFSLTRAFNDRDYRIDNPYPTDVVPGDGKQEIIFYVSGNDGKWLSSDSGAPFVALSLIAKTNVTDVNTNVTVRAEDTRLQDQSGTTNNEYASTSAKIHVGLPKKIEIVRGTQPPSSQPISMDLNYGMELNALARFANGDTTYVTEMAKWESANPDVVTVTGKGSLRGISYGTTSLTVTVGSLAGTHEAIVRSMTEKERNAQPGFQVTVTHVPSSDISHSAPKVQVTVNGKAAEQGLLVDGSVYVPLRSLGNLLVLPMGYDASRKLPTLDGKAITQSKIFAATSYVKIREIPMLLPGAKTLWDNKNKTLSIEYLF